MNTKERILWEALELFSRRGYGGVSVRDIAGAVGIRESSLYNHFKGKREIFEGIVDICWQKAKDYYYSRGLPFSAGEKPEAFREQGEQLVERVLEVFAWFFQDPYCTRFRRLLAIGRFEEEGMEELYRRLYCQYPMEVQEEVFRGLMEAGALREEDPKALAMELYSGVYLLMDICGSWEEAKPRLAEQISRFQRKYAADSLPVGPQTDC